MMEDRKLSNRLRVRRVVHAPLHEVSGICLSRGPNGRNSLIAVGDRMSKSPGFRCPVAMTAELIGIQATSRSSQVLCFPRTTRRSKLCVLTASGAFWCFRKHLRVSNELTPGR